LIQYFREKFVDIFDIQEDTAEGIANALNKYFDDEKREDMFSRGTQNADAYEAYLRGNKLFGRAYSAPRLGDDNLLKYLASANTLYQEGIRLDPNFTAVYYRHQDLYVHYLLHHPKNTWPEDLTKNKVVDILRRDFSNAVKYGNTTGERIFYALENTLIANDWSWGPALLTELESKEEYLKSMGKLGLGRVTLLLMDSSQKEAIAHKKTQTLQPGFVMRNFININ
jgi:hypothetical protein